MTKLKLLRKKLAEEYGYELPLDLIIYIYSKAIEAAKEALEDSKKVHGSKGEVLAWLEGRLEALIPNVEKV